MTHQFVNQRGLLFLDVRQFVHGGLVLLVGDGELLHQRGRLLLQVPHGGLLALTLGPGLRSVCEPRWIRADALDGRELGLDVGELLGDGVLLLERERARVAQADKELGTLDDELADVHERAEDLDRPVRVRVVQVAHAHVVELGDAAHALAGAGSCGKHCAERGAYR